MNVPPARALTWARVLVVASFVTVMFSPPVTNLLQVVLVLLIIASCDLRRRLWSAMRQPMVLGALAFFAVLTIGALYTQAPAAEGWGMVWGWRKLLLLPIAASLFDEPAWKVRLLKVLAAVAGLLAIGSIVMFLAQVGPPPFIQGRGPGVLVRNHATQGIIFSMAAISAAGLVIFGLEQRRSMQLAWAAAVVALVASVTLVTTGRTGYVAIVVAFSGLALGWSITRSLHWWKTALVTGTVFAVLATILTFSPVAQQRIQQATSEMETYTQATTETSMGVRMYFWQNALVLVQQRPLIGWGTGGFETGYGQLVAGRTGNAGLVTNDPHNQFLKIAAEHGVLGFAVFAGFLLMALRQKPSPAYRTLGLSALAVWCATSMANSHFSTYAEGTFIYLWLGAMLAFKPPGGAPPGQSA